MHAQEYRTWHGKAAAAKKGKDRRWMTGETGSFGERERSDRVATILRKRAGKSMASYGVGEDRGKKGGW